MNRFIYLFGRICAVVNKPLLILFTERFVDLSSANVLSELFVSTILISTLVNFDSHKNFYSLYFNQDFVSNDIADLTDSFSLYISCLIIQLAIAAAGIFVLLIILGQPISIAILGSFYLLSERVFDELQRFSIFDSSLTKLGFFYSLRLLVQVAILSFSSLFASISLYAIAIAVAISNMSILLGLPVVLFASFSVPSTSSVINTMRSNIDYWLLSVSGLLAQQGDKILVLLVDPQILASYYLMSSILSLIVNAVDFFVLVPFRSKLVNKSILSVKAIISTRTLKLSLILSSLLSLIICIIFSFVTSMPFYYSFLLPVLLIQLSSSLSLIIREYNYWNIASFQLLKDEWLYVTSVFICMLFVKLVNIPLVAIYLLSLVQIIRVFVLYTSSNRCLIRS